VADKQVPLSIIIRAVDRATAVVRKVNDVVNRFSGVATIKAFGESLKGLAKEAGLGELGERFSGIGSALKGIGEKLLVVGAAAAGAVAILFHLVDEFDDLGDKGDKLGVTVDFLAAMRFAAERSGAKVEQLDAGLTTFVQNLGQARAGTGRMVKFLNMVSPALLQQLTATKSNEEAFRLLADAMAKIQDPAKRLALAQKTVGDSDLAPLLARGSAGLLELQGEFAGTAGSLEAAAAGAGAVDDSLKSLHAATTGVKAALIGGLAPALQQVVEELTAFLSENRERIAEWATDFGKTLPDRVHNFVETLHSVAGKVSSFVEAIGGLKVVAIAVAAAIAGPLISSIVSLGFALYANPILALIAAIAAGAVLIIRNWDTVSEFFRRVGGAILASLEAVWVFIKEAFLNFTPLGQIIKNWEPIRDFFTGLWDGVIGVFRKAWEYIQAIVDKVTGAVDSIKGAVSRAIDFINPFSSSDEGSVPVSQIAARAVDQLNRVRAESEARVSVDFNNAPRGTRVSADPRNTTTVDMSVGYQLGGFGGP
jgi:phage-related minor tail protein